MSDIDRATAIEARRHLEKLLEAHARLAREGLDDPWVLSEAVVVESQIRAALAAIDEAAQSEETGT